MLETCEAPTAKVEGPMTINGYDGTVYASPCGDNPLFIQGSGDQLLAAVVVDGALQKPAFEYIHSPVVDDESWYVDGGWRTWHAATAPIEVPAGTFAADCWEAGADSGFSLFYCRGVGLVQVSSSSQNYEMKLVSKNF